MKNIIIGLTALGALATATAPVEARLLHCRHGHCHRVVAPKVDFKHGTGVHFTRCRHHRGHLGHC